MALIPQAAGPKSEIAPTISPRLRWPLPDLRALAVHEDHRLAVPDYRLTPRTASGAARTCSYAVLLLADWSFEAAITRDAGGFWLELPVLAYDRVRHRPVPMDYPPPLLAAICHRLEGHHLRAKALAYGRREGRN